MMTKKNDVIDTPADRMLVVTRVFDAPHRLVWKVWTIKEHFDKWSFPRGFAMLESHSNLRVGGEWGFVLLAPDGEKCPCGGVYREIVPGRLLVMTQGWIAHDGTRPHDTIVTVRFDDAGAGRTKLTLEQSVFKSVESRDLHSGGWSESLDRLAEELANALVAYLKEHVEKG